MVSGPGTERPAKGQHPTGALTRGCAGGCWALTASPPSAGSSPADGGVEKPRRTLEMW